MSRFTDLFQEQEPVSTPEPVSVPKKVKAKEAPRGAYRPTSNHK